jgi:hypothetical protein
LCNIHHHQRPATRSSLGNQAAFRLPYTSHGFSFLWQASLLELTTTYSSLLHLKNAAHPRTTEVQDLADKVNCTSNARSDGVLRDVEGTG